MSAAIETVGVVGAGFMGSGIAESAARAGLPVVVHEPGHPALERSRERVERSVTRAVETGKLDSDAAKALIDSITWTDDVGALADSELVIEAVTEDPEVKTSVFATLDAVLDPGIDHRLQHLLDPDRAARRGDHSARARDRASLLQPGTGDEARRAGRRDRHRSRDGGAL